MVEQQSILSPYGTDAAAITTLSWVMFVGALIILLAVIGFAMLAHRGSLKTRRAIADERSIVIWGAILPTAVLVALLTYGLTLTAARTIPPETDALKIEISGEQWWWRVNYMADAKTPAFTTANEIRVPIGQQVEIKLSSPDVIHSFWVPNLAGKVDMIPGVVNRIRLTATKPGVFRGQCAEYCGGAHALMAFHAQALEPKEFALWANEQQQSAELPKTDQEKRGSELFLFGGCGGCHTIRGTEAPGTVGPDLTHVGSRISVAAGVLPNDARSFSEWIANNQHIKPNNRMPPFKIFSADELNALGAYLDSLK